MTQAVMQTHQDDLKSSVMGNSVNNRHPVSHRKCLHMRVYDDSRLREILV